MEDPKSLVFSRRDNTGAAAVFPRHGDPTDKIVDNYFSPAKAAQDKPDRNADMSLRNISSNLGKAWDIDFPELQDDFDTKVLTKLREYEQEPNKNKKRELWYDYQKEAGQLMNKINKSQKTQSEYVKKYTQWQNDQTGAYDENAPIIFEEYTQQKLDDRSDTPQVFKASKLDFYKYVVDNSKGHVEEKTKNVKQADGTYKNRTTVYLDEAGLKEEIRSVYQTAPQNYKNAFLSNDGQGKSIRLEFHEQNPQAKYLSKDEQAQLFDDFVVDDIYERKKNSFKLIGKEADSYKKTDGNINWNFGGTTAATEKGIFTLEKVDPDGNYKLSISAKGGKTSIVADKPMEWIVTGKEFKQKYPDLAEGVEDDMEMTIKGVLAYVQMNEQNKKRPVLGIKIEEVVAPDGVGDSTEEKIAALFATKVKRGEVINVDYLYENKSQLLKYGADPYEMYYGLKKKADQEYESRKKNSPQSARQKGAPSSTQSKVTPNVAGTSATNKAGFPPSYKTKKPK